MHDQIMYACRALVHWRLVRQSGSSPIIATAASKQTQLQFDVGRIIYRIASQLTHHQHHYHRSIDNRPAYRILSRTTMERSSSHSRTRRPSSRPTTPLRPSSRSSIRDAHGAPGTLSSTPSNPAEIFEPAFAELSDSMADLEANMMHLQLMHESLSRFSESFASFLYGLNMNAFCVDFPEVSSFHVNAVLQYANCSID